MKTVMIKTHEAWLATLMAAFMSRTENKQVLFDFSDILFRHFTWLENELIELGESYSYDRDSIPIKVEKLSVMLENIIVRLNEIDLQLMSSPDKNLDARISEDIKYMKSVLSKMNDEHITAFNMDRKFPGINLTEEATDALTLFLFEETYKEYELIMIYNYLKAHSKDAYLNRIFQILIDESFFHLKSFGDMGSKMGILAVPRIIMKELYQVQDVVQFLKDGIDEELDIFKHALANLSTVISEAEAKLNDSLKEKISQVMFIENEELMGTTYWTGAMGYIGDK